MAIRNTDRMMDVNTLSRHHGTFGCWVLFLIILISLLTGSCFYAYNYSTNFIGLRPDHRCNLPHLTNHTHEEQLTLGIPWDHSQQAYDQCLMYDSLKTSHVVGNGSAYTAGGSRAVVSCQHGWRYDTTVRESSYIMEWDLVCGSRWLSDIVAPVQMLGMTIGSITWSFLADRYGRKKTVLVLCAVSQISCLAAAYSPNVYMFMAVRFLMVVAIVSAYNCVYILGGELVHPKYRVVSSCISSAALPFGLLLLPAYAYIISDWRTLAMALAVSGVPLLVAMAILVPESPVWLTRQGRKKEALKIWEDLARRNYKEEHNPDPMDCEHLASGHAQEVDTKSSECENLRDVKEADDSLNKPKNIGGIRMIFTDTTCRRSFLAITISWVLSSFVDSGFAYNVDFLFGNVYVNMCALGAMEIGAKLLALLCLQKLGRITIANACIIACTLCTVLAIVCIYIQGVDGLITALAVLSRSFAAILNYTVYAIILELFPTSIGSHMLALAATLSYGAAIIAPYTAGSLTLIWAPSFYVAICVLGLLALILNVCCLPETKGVLIPENVEEMQALRDKTCIAAMGARLQRVKESKLSWRQPTANAGKNNI